LNIRLFSITCTTMSRLNLMKFSSMALTVSNFLILLRTA